MLPILAALLALSHAADPAAAPPPAAAPAPAPAAPAAPRPAEAPAAPAPAASTGAASKKEPGRTLNRVAAIVNGDVITLRDLEERAGLQWLQAQAEPEGPARERAQARALQGAFEALVAEKLLDAQVKETGVEATDAEIDSVIAETKQRFHLDDEALDRALASEGSNRQAYRLRVKRDLESYRVVQLRVRSRIKVTDDDVVNYYQQHPGEFASGQEIRVRHIFLPVPAGSPAAAEAAARGKAEKALARVRAGEDFAAVARAVSQGPSAADGGDLGWLRRGVVQAEVERAAFALETGQVSGLVRTRTGWQILKVEARRGGEPRPFDQVKDEIRDKLTNDQADVLRQQYVAELKKDAFIDVRLPELKAR
jgi:peptidyl-prolyl cis-trans isomerase SurA